MSIALIIPLPWFIFSFIHTGNPIYPFFSPIYRVPFPLQLLNPLYFIENLWSLLLYSPDPLNPIYLCLIPLIIISYKKFDKGLKYIFFYAVGGIIWWYITPNTGGGRFIIPYLPMFSILSVASIDSLPGRKIKKFLLIITIFIAMSSVGYRAIANAKFVPLLLGRETENQFLTKHLNFSYGDFYDIDGHFKNHIKKSDKVLLFGFHNLFYVDFPFVDASWIKKGEKFNYIATQNSNLPKRFKDWKVVYNNPMTHVSLFSLGGGQWTY